MPTAGKSPKKRAPRRKLTRTRVISAALKLADRGGVEGLSMRTLAKELGVEAMSLYTHVGSKGDLLGLICDRLMAELPPPDPDHPPRARLIRFLTAFRDIGHRHPHTFPLLVLLPQRIESASRPTEVALRALTELGVPAGQRVMAQRTLLSYVRGYTMWEIGGFATGRRLRPGSKPVRGVRDELKSLDPEQFRMVYQHIGDFMTGDPDQHFLEGLDIILDGLLRLKGR